MAGWSLQKLPTSRGMKYLAVLTAAMRSRPRDRPFTWSTCCSKASHSIIMARAAWASLRPGIGEMDAARDHLMQRQAHGLGDLLELGRGGGLRHMHGARRHG